MKNYHTHTARCGHAEGADEDFVTAAIEGGFDEIGFSDHAPMLFPEGLNYYSSFRMKPELIQDYVNSINALRKKYEGKIKIKLGFELEYYPDLFEKELEFLKSFDIDYLILGQHFTLNEFEQGTFYCGSKTEDDSFLNQYVSQVIEGLETGKFSYLAHPDLINYVGSREYYQQQMYRLCTRVKELGYPLEFNMYGFIDKRNYPNRDFWQIAAEVGNDVVIGLDAHWRDLFLMQDVFAEMRAYLAELGLTPLEQVNLIKP